MRSLKNFSSTIYFLGAFSIFLLMHRDSPKTRLIGLADDPFNMEELDKRTRMDLAMQQEFERTKDPALEIVPRNRLYKAYQMAESRRRTLGGNDAARLLGAIAGVSWKERGPNNLGGRTRAILVDPNDVSNKTIWSASIAGGLWKTTDITKENPDWSSVNDFFENMAITTIAYDPTTTTTMYFGTGEGFFNVDAIQGNGIWKSTDSGSTWSQLTSTVTDNFSTCAGAGGCDFLYVNKIVVTASGSIIAATRSRFSNFGGGLMRSIDGGSTWSKFEGLTGVNACTGSDFSARGVDVEIAANGDIFAGFGIFENQGIWKSTDDGATWGSPVYTSSCDEQRIEIATAPNDANYIYALVQEDDNTIKKVMRSTNGGTIWNTLTTPTWFDQDCGAASTDFTRTQAWYDLTLAVDPNDEQTVYIGGVDIFRTTDGGTTWTQMTNWAGNCDYPEVHADQHSIVYQPGSSDVMYFGNDGGIYYTPDGSAATPTFSRKEFGYNTSQFYSIAMHPTAFSPNFIGGTQDNGSNKVTSLGVSSVVEVTGGDGGFAHIDQDEPQYQFTAFTGLTLSRSSDSGLTFETIFNFAGGSFINPSDYADIDDAYYAASSAGEYFVSPDVQTTASAFGSGPITAFNSGDVTAITTSPNTSERVWFGLDNGEIVRVENAASAPAAMNISTGLPTGVSVSCIAVETGNDNHLLVTYSNYGTVSVWETINGGTSWTAVEGNLPDMPVRWALFNPNNSDEALIATELGVWSTDNLNGGTTDWDPSNNGLANVRTDMLQVRSSDNLVVAGTHGRGVFTSDVFASVHSDFTADRNAIYAEASINFTDASYKATSWEWDFGDGGISTAENPSHTYMRFGKYEVTLTINGGGDTETKTDFIHVLPNVGTPFSAADGGDFETNTDYFGSDDLTGGINLWERGVPGNVRTTVSSGTDAWKTNLTTDITEADYSCALYSPNFNFSVAGTYTLSFQKSMEINFSNAPMGVQVQYSTDNGENWTRLGSDDGAGTNWYERGPSSVTALATNVIHDRIGFNSNFSNQATARDVSFLSGNETVAFRVVLYVASGYSTAGYTRDGFMIDDFEISGPSNEANVNVVENAPGTYLTLDGVNDYTTLSNLSLNESFTAEMWISPGTDSDGQTFLGKHDGSGNDIFKIGYNNGGIEVDLRGTTTSGGAKTTGMQHIAVSVDKLTVSTSQITVYRNGEQVFQNTINEVIGSLDGLDWVVGQDWDGVGVPSDYFGGSIDELRLWNAVRTESEIQQNIFLIVDGLDTDLAGYWQFNENTGTATTNSITSNDGTLNGVSWNTSTAPVGMGTSYTATINTDGSTAFGSGLSVNFTGVSGSFDVVAFEINNTPIGTLPEDDNILTEVVNTPYWIINTYGVGTFTSASLTYTYGSGAFTETDPASMFLFKRGSTESTAWSTTIGATSLNPGTGVAVFDNITSFSQTVMGASSVPLPVELVFFEGERSKQSTQLRWQTSTEINNDFFEILRSTHGTPWIPITTIDSKAAGGNSDQTLDYSFTDWAAFSVRDVYYQLRQVDFDGKSNLSHIENVQIDFEEDLTAAIYPNPAKDKLSLTLASPYQERMTIEILGLSGQKHLIREINVSKGINQLFLDVSRFNDGIYLLNIKMKGRNMTKRFIVQ